MTTTIYMTNIIQNNPSTKWLYERHFINIHNQGLKHVTAITTYQIALEGWPTERGCPWDVKVLTIPTEHRREQLYQLSLSPRYICPWCKRITSSWYSNKTQRYIQSNKKGICYSCSKGSQLDWKITKITLSAYKTIMNFVLDVQIYKHYPSLGYSTWGELNPSTSLNITKLTFNMKSNLCAHKLERPLAAFQL